MQIKSELPSSPPSTSSAASDSSYSLISAISSLSLSAARGIASANSAKHETKTEIGSKPPPPACGRPGRWGEGKSSKSRRNAREREAMFAGMTKKEQKVAWERAVQEKVRKAGREAKEARRMAKKEAKKVAPMAKPDKPITPEAESRSSRASSESSFDVVSQGTMRTGSIISAEDAKSSLDLFMLRPGRLFSQHEKLRIWQSLCYELGLADFDHDFSDTASIKSSSTFASTNSTETTSTTFSTSTILARPMPQTLTSAKNLLKSEGHVNIADYLQARKDGTGDSTCSEWSSCTSESSISQTGSDSGSETTECGADNGRAGRYRHLVHSSAGSMIKYTFKKKRFVRLEVAKAEVMQPLLRDFGVRRARG